MSVKYQVKIKLYLFDIWHDVDKLERISLYWKQTLSCFAHTVEQRQSPNTQKGKGYATGYQSY